MLSMRRFLGALLILSQVASAEVATISGTVKLSGNGCPKNGTTISIADDLASLSVLFSNYNLEIGGATNKHAAAKACVLTIPLTIPSGYKLKVNTVDYRGFVEAPAKAKGQFTSHFVLVDSRSGSSAFDSFTFRGPVSEDLFLQPDRSVRGRACGGKATLWIITSALLTSNRKVSTSLLQIDSLDFGTDPSFSEHISLERCR